MTTKKIRSLHRQIGLAASLWLVIAALTTLVLNHRKLLFPPAAQGSGPYSHYLMSHAICASQPDLVLVGTDSGVFSSENGGKSFTQVNLPVEASQVVAVAFHPNEPSHYYVVLRQQGIYSSLDSGKLWTKINFPSQASIQSFQVGFDGALSVLTNEGLHRRVAENWSLVPAGPTAANPHRDILRTAYNLHDGSAWGPLGLWVTDLLALSILALVASGVVMWRRQPA
ncbi:MAG: PepSY domain-containing protein [Candidatus Eremiobacteraeota bacterium]|nr:PepSY domain-containing protein [Candidatus Eremiobacteraeota bacterium]